MDDTILANKQREIFNDTSLTLHEKNKLINEIFAIRMEQGDRIKYAKDRYSKWNEVTGFSPEFSCREGVKLALSDAKHDFGAGKDAIVKKSLPCKNIHNEVGYGRDETVELKETIKDIIGGENLSINDLNIIAEGGDMTGYKQLQNITNTDNYLVLDAGNLGYQKTKLKDKIMKGSNKLIYPPVEMAGKLQKLITDSTGLKKVYIIDDIHTNSFINNIMSVPSGSLFTPVEKPFWCYMQTAQTIFDPAGKIEPSKGPGKNIFIKGSNVEFAWQDIRSDKKKLDPGQTKVENEIISYPITENKKIITSDDMKLILNSPVTLTISGNPYNPRSHKVNFLYKLQGTDEYAVFNNKTSAIKNRNYMSTTLSSFRGVVKSIMKQLKSELGIRSHFVAKRFGDQGQANVCTKPSIPLLKYNYTGNTTNIVAEETNGAHIFVSKDRLAIAAALRFGVPMILHLKEGRPKTELHHILYINKDLATEEAQVNNLLIEYNVLYGEYVNTLNTGLPKISDSSLENITVIKNSDKNLGIDTSNDDFPTMFKTFQKDIPRISRIEKIKSIFKNYESSVSDLENSNKTFEEPSSVTGNDIEYVKRSVNNIKEFVDKIKELKIIINSIDELISEYNSILISDKGVETVNIVPYRLSTRSKGVVRPSTLNELRKQWIKLYPTLNSINEKIAIYFTNECIRLSGQYENKDAFAKLTGFQIVDVVDDSPLSIGNSPFYPEGFSTLALKRQRDDLDNTQIYPSYEPVKKQKIENWITRLYVEPDGLIKSSKLLRLVFVRNIFILLFDRNDLLEVSGNNLIDIQTMSQTFIETYIKNDGLYNEKSDIGYNSPSIEEIEDNALVEIEQNVCAEIDYFYESHNKYGNKFMANVIDVLWNIRIARDNIIDEAEGLESHIDDDEYSDPVVNINEYAREILTTDSTDNPSTNILFTKDYNIDGRCAFFRNYILPYITLASGLEEDADIIRKLFG